MNDKNDKLDALRAEAEAQVAHVPINLVNPQPGEELLHKLLHELQVHQVELQMQNDALRQAQIAMEESRDRYVDLYDFAPIAYFTLTRDGMINELNLTAGDLLGVVRNKLVNRRFAQYVAAEDRERWYQHFASVLQHEQRQRCELTFQLADGSRFQAQLYSQKSVSSVNSSALDDASSAPAETSVRVAIIEQPGKA
jgi:PAS domain S-box-containing protein